MRVEARILYVRVRKIFIFLLAYAKEAYNTLHRIPMEIKDPMHEIVVVQQYLKSQMKLLWYYLLFKTRRFPFPHPKPGLFIFKRAGNRMESEWNKSNTCLWNISVRHCTNWVDRFCEALQNLGMIMQNSICSSSTALDWKEGHTFLEWTLKSFW